MNRFNISCVVIIVAAFSASVRKFQANQCRIFRCQPVLSKGFVTVGSAIYSHASPDVLDFNYRTIKCSNRLTNTKSVLEETRPHSYICRIS